MKKIITILMALCMSGTAIADSLYPPCPPLDVVRNIGNKFTNAYDAGNDFWVLWTNDGYKVGEDVWMTTLYTPRFPHNTDNATALMLGKKLFDNAVLLTNPVRAVHGPVTTCEFNPKNAGYIVIVGSRLKEA